MLFIVLAFVALYGAYWSLIHQLDMYTLVALLVALLFVALFGFHLIAKRR